MTYHISIEPSAFAQSQSMVKTGAPTSEFIGTMSDLVNTLTVNMNAQKEHGPEDEAALNFEIQRGYTYAFTPQLVNKMKSGQTLNWHDIKAELTGMGCTCPELVATLFLQGEKNVLPFVFFRVVDSLITLSEANIATVRQTDDVPAADFRLEQHGKNICLILEQPLKIPFWSKTSVTYPEIGTIRTQLEITPEKGFILHPIQIDLDDQHPSIAPMIPKIHQKFSDQKLEGNSSLVIDGAAIQHLAAHGEKSKPKPRPSFWQRNKAAIITGLMGAGFVILGIAATTAVLFTLGITAPLGIALAATAASLAIVGTAIMAAAAIVGVVRGSASSQRKTTQQAAGSSYEKLSTTIPSLTKGAKKLDIFDEEIAKPLQQPSKIEHPRMEELDTIESNLNEPAPPSPSRKSFGA